MSERAFAHVGFTGTSVVVDPDRRVAHALLTNRIHPRWTERPFNADSGFHTAFARLPFNVPLATTSDYDNYIARMRDWPRYVGEQIVLMTGGISRGFTQPRAILAGYEGSMDAQVVDDPGRRDHRNPLRAEPLRFRWVDIPRTDQNHVFVGDGPESGNGLGERPITGSGQHRDGHAVQEAACCGFGRVEVGMAVQPDDGGW